jgi:hypothetical protein
MIERTNRRKALLQETSVDTLPSTDVPPSTDKEILPPIHQSKTPPLRSDRRARLAELASRVGQWLEDEVKPHDPKPINNEFTPTVIMIQFIYIIIIIYNYKKVHEVKIF